MTRDSVAWWILMEVCSEMACSRILFFKALGMRRDFEDSSSNLYLSKDSCYYKTES
jgi:hypothetical protein